MRSRRHISAMLIVLVAVLATGGCSSGPSKTTTRHSSNAQAVSTSPSADPPPACLRPDGGCLGPLTKGSYDSTRFAAFGSAGPDQLAFSVADDSWANALDHEAGYWFQDADAYARSDGDATLEGVYLFADAAAATQNYPACSEESDPSVQPGAASLLGWIRTLPGLRTEPVPDLVTATGRAPGILIRTRAGAHGNCYDGATVRTFVASRPGSLDPYVWGITSTEVIEAHFEDIGEHTVAILLYSPSGTLSSEFTARARELASTFEFRAPSS